MPGQIETAEQLERALLHIDSTKMPPRQRVRRKLKAIESYARQVRRQALVDAVKAVRDMRTAEVAANTGCYLDMPDHDNTLSLAAYKIEDLIAKLDTEARPVAESATTEEATEGV